MRKALSAALLLTSLAPAWAAAGAARTEAPLKTVIPVYPARAAGAATAVKPGSLPALPALAAPSVPAAASPAGASPDSAAQLGWLVALSNDATLSGDDAGAVALEVKGVGDTLFDMRRDQLEQQWPAVAAAVREEALKPTLTKQETYEGVRVRVERLIAERRVGGLRLDAELAAPLQGMLTLVGQAATRTRDAAGMRALADSLLSGFDRAVRAAAGLSAAPKPVVNDVTQLNPVQVDRVLAPTSIEQISRAVAGHQGAVSVGGGRFSMGGQTASEDALQLDLRQYNKVLSFDPQAKEITVQPGIRWRDLQKFIDPHDLSVKIMQTYADFTVGGALSVNAHGRYLGLGPVVLSVKKIKVVLADGRIVTASPDENKDVFYAAIGGYGGVGVIAEATLSLADNKPLEQRLVSMPASEYKDFFFKNVRNDSAAVFHNADLRPPYDHATSITFYETDRPVTVKARMRAQGGDYWAQKLLIYLITERPWGQLYRRAIDWARERLPNPVVWRNYEASYDVLELEPNSRKDSTYALQEYFIPVEKFDEFRPKMAEILNRYKVNALNVSVRHAKADPGSTLAWARQEVFAFVLYHKQGTSEADKGRVGVWTRELIDAAIASGGAYYLPYQLHARPDQFHAAYPRAKEFFELKKKLDPTGKFTNKLWDKYYFGEATEQEPPGDRKSNFKTVYQSTRLRDRFYRYLQNIFHIYPEEKLHQVLLEETVKGPSDDKAIYQAAEPRVKEIKPFLAPLRYALPALGVQKNEMADETAELLGERGQQPINGYLEWGTLGRYVTPLQKRLNMKGPVYVASYQPMGFSPEAILERGGLRRPGTYIENHAEPISPEQVPDASVDLITVYPGLHHHPLKKLDPFVASLWRILRPGGRLVIRDHDVEDADGDQFTGLVHDVYNLGVGEHWDNNEKEIRHFTSNDGLEKAMLGRGFRSTGKRIHQKNDPTQNVLMEFEKIDLPGQPAALSTHHRKPELTYLTIPEWFIVYASRDYAKALAEGPPSAFNYWGAVTQYWGEYRRAVKNAGPNAMNRDAQLMLGFIGVSHSVEFMIKGLYENTLGRVGEWMSDGGKTEEDAFAAKVAKDYIDFIDHTPWYRFPYKEKLAELKKIPVTGRYQIRKLARRGLLKAEYGFKAWFAELTRKGAESAYEPESLETMIVAKTLAPEVLAAEPRLKLYAELADGRSAYLAPRYGPFTSVAQKLASAGVELESVAGNKDALALTVLAPAGWQAPAGLGEKLSAYRTLGDENVERVTLKTPVAQLGRLLRALSAEPVVVEHVYDY